jgi:hypothetical protein
MRCEGHPVLWFLLLFGLTPIHTCHLHNAGAEPVDCDRYCVSDCCALPIQPDTKSPSLFRVLSSFPLYEYGTISRNYGVGLLLLFWFCVGYRREPRQSWIGSAVLLSLLANTSVYGAMIAMAFAVSFIMIPAIAMKNSGKPLSLSAQSVIVTLILLVGFTIAILQMHPPPDTFKTWEICIPAFLPSRRQ